MCLGVRGGLYSRRQRVKPREGEHRVLATHPAERERRILAALPAFTHPCFAEPMRFPRVSARRRSSALTEGPTPARRGSTPAHGAQRDQVPSSKRPARRAF